MESQIVSQCNLLEIFADTPEERVELALQAMREGNGVLVVDDENRENEGDIIFAAEKMTEAQMAMMIRYCSGIVCLCMPEEKMKQLELPQMVSNNTSSYGTAFTITIEAAKGVTTGVSAHDRLTTIKAAINPDAKPSDLSHPGHVFPLTAKTGGVLVRDGHTEASVDLARLAGLNPSGVLCELTNDDGTMARLPQVVAFGLQHNMTVVSILDIVAYRKAHNV
ncbi:MAG: 3,4-dihydroxy-2-butanone-4-phosphate synthase [Ruminobacter sp.]|jgi:3,4-dihydroxy 2-butanone 4-phosphate synthase|uniref:3,4-dihydroxy-2-butanone-4-phosphate synthase n=1 Tax=Ruminobacter TaxID=866 RepID=UPI0004E2259C|nr:MULTISPECIES: 3,4-dihydroxy-2-butanone-4-phosphate synthase [Ruminobacter]MBQ3775961.1 3,4-dihydroxy-2-butanone-4-phosphate synthase [Ruminobacter sp.]